MVSVIVRNWIWFDLYVLDRPRTTTTDDIQYSHNSSFAFVFGT